MFDYQRVISLNLPVYGSFMGSTHRLYSNIDMFDFGGTVTVMFGFCTKSKILGMKPNNSNPYASNYLLKGSLWGIIYYNLEDEVRSQTVAMDPSPR